LGVSGLAAPDLSAATGKAHPKSPEPPAADPAQRSGSLLVRIASATVLLAAILVALALGQPAAYIVLGALIMVGVVEFYLITRRMGTPAAPWVLFPLTLVFLVRFQLNRYSAEILPGAITASVVLGLGGFLLARRPTDGMTRWAFAVAGSLYLGWSLGYYFALFAIRDPDPARIGTAWLASLTGSTVIGDTAALLIGTRFGRHPFFPGISPKKTLEGAAAGFVAQTIFFALMIQLADVAPLHGLILGALVAIAAQAGDLIESQFKRAARVKDASGLIPGHGGMLDRMDSLVLIPAVAYYYIALVLHTPLPQ
jgi:phosphatidate cytidylyltransferase